MNMDNVQNRTEHGTSISLESTDIPETSESSSFELSSVPINGVPSKSRVSHSDFGDSACGEPLCAQHLVIDFTPNEEIDNDAAQKKCCAFWKFINNHPELKDLMVSPDSDIYFNTSGSSEHTPSDSKAFDKKTDIEEEPVKKDLTALSMLEFVENKGLIDRTFEAKLPQSLCSLGSREYKLDRDTTPMTAPKKKESTVCTCAGVCKKCKKQKSVESAPSSSASEVQMMCQEMRKWDSKHPKSMAPPGHPPALTHCILQRNVFV